MSAYTMTIAGESVQARGTFDVVDPATARPFASAPDGNGEHMERALQSAHDAFGGWRRDLAQRRRALAAAAELIKANSDQLARLLTQEQGKPYKQAVGEVRGASGLFRYYAGLEIPVEVTHQDENGRIELHRKPYGVVAAITPWNYPLLTAATKVAAALIAGNTVVLKPSPFTPLTSLELGRLLRDVLPAGVLNVVSGGDEAGRMLSEHPLVRKVSFTGSVATGKKVALAAAPDLKRVTLELGGNDPAIVLDDVDPKRVAHDLFWGAFMNSGQVCTAIKRLYVHESVYPAVVEALSEIARGIKVGPGLEAGVDLGPINNAPQYQRVCSLFDDARARGARVRAGEGSLGRDGYFFTPTLLTDVSDEVPIVAEEQFGPVLPILPFTKVEDALERANATHFGLSGSVWTSNVERGTAVAAELECGTAWVNQHMALSAKAPFGGSKWSGIGYENGRWGLDAFCEYQVMNVRTGAPAK